MEKKNETPKIKVKKTERLISFNEFFAGREMREGRKAAFKMILDGDLNHTLKEWEKLLEDFEK